MIGTCCVRLRPKSLPFTYFTWPAWIGSFLCVLHFQQDVHSKRNKNMLTEGIQKQLYNASQKSKASHVLSRFGLMSSLPPIGPFELDGTDKPTHLLG